MGEVVGMGEEVAMGVDWIVIVRDLRSACHTKLQFFYVKLISLLFYYKCNVIIL